MMCLQLSAHLLTTVSTTADNCRQLCLQLPTHYKINDFQGKRIKLFTF